MRKILIIFFVCFVLAGCAPTQRSAWYKDGASLEQTARDRFDCKVIAQQTLRITEGDLDFTPSDFGRNFLAECMRSRGYVPRGVEPNIR